MKILLFDGDVSCLVRFRGDFARELVKRGNEVEALVPVLNSSEKASMDSLGIKYTNINLARTNMSPVKIIKEFFRVRRHIKQINPDIIFNYTAKPFLLGSIAAKLLKVKKIYSMLPGLGFIFIGNSLKKKLLRLIVCILYKISFACNNRAFVLNKDDHNELIQRKLITEKKLVMIRGEGVDLEHYSDDNENKNITPPVFLFVGRLIREKGINDFVKAAEIIKKEHPEIEFRVAGNVDKNPSSITLEELKELSRNKTINYIGFINDIREEFKKSSVFVLPSYYREGLPRSTMEALSMKVPVITTINPGCRESIEDGTTGYLTPINKPEVLAQKIEKFIQKPELVNKMGLNARAFAEKHYNVNIINDEIANIILG